jgi:hypothetical protein
LRDALHALHADVDAPQEHVAELPAPRSAFRDARLPVSNALPTVTPTVNLGKPTLEGLADTMTAVRATLSAWPHARAILTNAGTRVPTHLMAAREALDDPPDPVMARASTRDAFSSTSPAFPSTRLPPRDAPTALRDDTAAQQHTIATFPMASWESGEDVQGRTSAVSTFRNAPTGWWGRLLGGGSVAT